MPQDPDEYADDYYNKPQDLLHEDAGQSLPDMEVGPPEARRVYRVRPLRP